METPKAAAVGAWARLGAFVVDGVALGAVGLALGFAAFDQLAALGPNGRLIGLFMAVAYFGVIQSRMGGGQSPGMRLLKLRVVGPDSQPLGLGRSVLRAIVLTLPIILNGWMFQGASSGLVSAVLGVTLITAVFGVALAQLYLLVFNRAAGQMVHDLVVGSRVVAVAAEAQVQVTPRSCKTVAAVIVGAVFVIGAATVAMVGNWKPQFLDDLLPVQAAVAALPEVASAGVNRNITTWSGTDGSRVSHTLIITVRLRKWPKDLAAEAQRIGQAASAAYTPRPGEQMMIALTRGFDLGIGSSWRTERFPYTPPAAAKPPPAAQPA